MDQRVSVLLAYISLTNLISSRMLLMLIVCDAIGEWKTGIRNRPVPNWT